VKKASRHLPHLPRSPGQIDAGLRVWLRRLISAEAPWPLLLHGPAGTGKTCVGLCLLDWAGGEYWTAAGWCALMIEAQQGRIYTGAPGYGAMVLAEDLWRLAGRAALVVLDELGCRERVSDWHYEQVKGVLDARAGRPLVVISNLAPGKLATLYDDRIVSRLGCGTIVELGGKDRRVEG